MSFTPPECCGNFLPIQRKCPRAIQSYRDSSPKSFFLLSVQASPADVNTDLLIINLLWRYRESVNAFFLSFVFAASFMSDASDRYILIFHMAARRFKGFLPACTSDFYSLGSHQAVWSVELLFSSSCVSLWERPSLEVAWSYSGKQFSVQEISNWGSIAEASWLAEKVDYHISGEGYLLVSEISQDGCPGGVSHSLLEDCRAGESSFTTGEVFQQMCFPLCVHHRNVFTCRLGFDLECLGGSWQLPVGEIRSTESQI